MKKLKKMIVFMQDNEHFTIPQRMVRQLYLKKFEPVIGIDSDGNFRQAIQVGELSITVDEQMLNTIKTPSLSGGLGSRGLDDTKEIRLIFDTGTATQLILPWKNRAGEPAYNLDYYQGYPKAGILKLFWSDDEYQVAEQQEIDQLPNRRGKRNEVSRGRDSV